jgi:hypothetical protein
MIQGVQLADSCIADGKTERDDDRFVQDSFIVNV